MPGLNKMNNIPIYLQTLMIQLQDWTINRIASDIAKSYQISSSAEYLMTTLSELSMFEVDLKTEIQRILKMSDKKINKIFQDAAESSYLHDTRVFKGEIPFVPFEQNEFMQNLVESTINITQGEIRNITRSMGFAYRVNDQLYYKPIATFYHEQLDSAVYKVAAGVQTFDEAVTDAVKKMANSGLKAVTYETGHVSRIDVAARRAMMGGMRYLVNAKSERNAQQMGVTVYEISWHGGHRPSHAWGGRRFDITGIHYPTERQLYAKYPSPKGEIGTLDDYNCYHEKYAVFPESPPTFTDEELDEMEKNELVEKEFEGKKFNAYKARQHQRYLERLMRKQHSIVVGYKGAGVPDLLKLEKIKFEQLISEYRRFCDKFDFSMEMARVYTGIL